MELKKKVMACVLGIAAMFVGVSCTDQKEETQMRSVAKATSVEPTDPERYGVYNFGVACNPTESSFEHIGTSTIDVFVKGNDTPERSFEKSLKSNCNITRTPDTVRVSDGYTAGQQNVSIARKRSGNVERDTVRISVSDGRTLVLPYSAEHANAENYLGVAYTHGHDSLVAASLVNVENHPIVVNGEVGGAEYIKAAYNTTYSVEVSTSAYDGTGKNVGSHKDILKTTAVTLVMADNNTTATEGGYGIEILNETQQKDSVIITTTWADGHSENSSYPIILSRWLKNVEKREVVVASFENQNAETTFTKDEKAEKIVREDDLWTVYGREVVIKKSVTVAGVSETVSYTYYQERAEFHHKSGVKHSFNYVDWQIANYNDDFKVAAISTKSGYDVLNYTNEIRTDYAGFVQMSNEAIDWIKEQVKITGYGVINAVREDKADATYVSLEKIAYMSDGTQQTVGKFSANMPISVKPLTNWVINADVWGVYTSGEFAQELTAKSSDTAEKFFAFNRYTYKYSNKVSGEENAYEVSVANDIVFNDGDVEYTFTNTELSSSKKSEGTSYVGEDDAKTTYSYACVASVTFGATQEVTLPGTIYLAKAQVNPEPDPDPDPDPDPEPNNPVVHTHGKVVDVKFTSTLNEDRSYWKNVCVIVFEDGYRSVGMANNDDMTFDFTMESYKKVNSAVYYNKGWHVSIAADKSSAMTWSDENGKGKRSLEYVAATAMRWNNGHNTIVDVRREGRISEDGYSVTLRLNGLDGQTLNF